MKILKLISFVLFIIVVQKTPAQSPVPEASEVEKIAEGFQFLEGPVWKKDLGLLFSDIPANTIYLWSPESGTSVYLQPSGNSNGLAIDTQNNLILAQHGNRRLARIDSTQIETALVTHYQDKRLNSPNDMAIKSDGSIFFTDPPYGISSDQEELDFYGIYRLNSKSEISLLDKSLYRPNGIAFSPDETKLYVSDSESRRIYVWDVLSDSLIANKRLFAFMNAPGNADGMKTDASGNLFATGPMGVWVYSPDGTILDTILVPGQTTNCNWGDPDGKTLYITSGSELYRIRIGITTLDSKSQRLDSSPKSCVLYANYPNPFNSRTIIPFYLAQTGWVNLSIYNLAGDKVKTLIHTMLQKEMHQVLWDTQTDLSSGVYMILLKVLDQNISRKSLFLK